MAEWSASNPMRCLASFRVQGSQNLTSLVLCRVGLPPAFLGEPLSSAPKGKAILYIIYYIFYMIYYITLKPHNNFPEQFTLVQAWDSFARHVARPLACLMWVPISAVVEYRVPARRFVNVCEPREKRARTCMGQRRGRNTCAQRGRERERER